MPPTPYLRDADPVLPVFFLSALVHFVAQHGANPQALLKGSGLDAARLQDPETRVNFRAISRVIRQCEDHWPSGDLGLHFGRSLHVLSLGMIGQAALASATLGQALTTIGHYLILRDPLLHIEVLSTDESSIFRFDNPLALQDVERFVVDAALSAAHQFIEQLAGGPVPGLQLTVRHSVSAPTQATWLGSSVEYDAPHNSFSLPRIALDIPLATANPMAAEEARRYCDQRIAQMAGAVGIASAVRTFLAHNLKSAPREEDAAHALGYSTRNLRRRLAHEQLSYRQLKEEVARQEAITLLQASDARIEDIAFAVGYGTAGNFCRAFKRWTGVSPNAYRRQD
jgi:AraC-like DNA-binding protein